MRDATSMDPGAGSAANAGRNRMPWRLALSIALIVAGSAVTTAWRMHDADERFRFDLLQQATIVSWALRSDHIAALSGDASDLTSPYYQRIKDQLVRSRTLYPACRFLYVMRRDAGGRITFLVDSEPPESEAYSPPGQAYEEATEDFHAVFTTGRPSTEGPVRDRWGSWISASVPLFHPLDDRVVAVLGLDVDAAAWRNRILEACAVPIAFGVLLLAISVIGHHRISARRRADRLSSTLTTWIPEVSVMAAAGIVLTVFAVGVVSESEDQNRRDAFRRRATIQASQLQQFLFRIGDNYLEGVARLFIGSSFVDQGEFRGYVEYLLNRPYAQAWAWLPAVALPDIPAYEAAVRRNGNPGYAIWELGADGGRAKPTGDHLLYPIAYIEPAGSNLASLGLDVASLPGCGDALDAAARTRLVTASDPVSIVPFGATTNTILVFRPVFAGDDPNRLSGYAAVALLPEILLYRALSRQSTKEEATSLVDLFQMVEPNHLLRLASNHRVADAAPESMDSVAALLDDDSFLAPAFAFGKVYALVARPGPGFLDLYPRRAAGRTALLGLALTGLLTALIGTLATRRAALERLVAERTADLKERERSYHGLFNAIQQAIYIQDAQGRFLDVNEGAVRMYGRSREEFIGRSPDFVSAPGRNDLRALARAFELAWNGMPQYFEFWGVRKDGEVFPKDVWLSKGSYFGQPAVIAFATDVSERKRSEAERENLQTQLQQAQKMESIGRLAGGVAHDFNNMLQAILGNTTLALEEAPSGPIAEYLHEIRRSADRSADLTRQLLAFASRQTVSPRVIDLNDTIGGMLKMLRRLIGEDIQLQWVPGADVWPVKMDPSQVDQILANLAVNARDAIKGVGTVTIETRNVTCAETHAGDYGGCVAGEYAVLVVRDTGCGMDAETKAHIFEPFYTTKEHGKGVGLGLATVFGIVKQNRGCIRVDSEPGKGTTFTIGIPRTELTPTPSSAETPPAPVRGGGETLLLVEDEKAILRFSRESLERLGYHILTARSPLEAIEIVRRQSDPIDLLVTDVVLPEMNGRELADILTALVPGLRCLFMSGYTADIIATRGVLDEKTHFIQKPFSVDALATRIRDILDGTPPRQG